MKNLIGYVLASLLIGALSLSSSAQAQRTQRVIRANIPFDFTVGGHNLPAGDYELVRIQPSLLELRDLKGRFLANAITLSVERPDVPTSPKLLFENEGGRHVLTQVWQENDSIGQQLLQTKSSIHAVQKHSGHVQTAKESNPL